MMIPRSHHAMYESRPKMNRSCDTQAKNQSCTLQISPIHAKNCNSLQHTATRCNTLEHTVTHCQMQISLWCPC